MSFEHKCRPCSGDGYYGANSRDTCQVCQGRGVINVSGNWDDYQKCRPCSGDGYYGANSKETCQVCGGLGIVTRAFAE